jgi:hypothetical protein
MAATTRRASPRSGRTRVAPVPAARELIGRLYAHDQLTSDDPARRGDSTAAVTRLRQQHNGHPEPRPAPRIRATFRRQRVRTAGGPEQTQVVIVRLLLAFAVA